MLSPAVAGITQIAAVRDAVDATTSLDRLQAYRPTGRQGYSVHALWRVYLASFALNLPSTNALIRRLEDAPELRAVCGFGALPRRTTFNRFINRLSHHQDLVNECMTALTDRRRILLPGLGEKVAIERPCGPTRIPTASANCPDT